MNILPFKIKKLEIKADCHDVMLPFLSYIIQWMNQMGVKKTWVNFFTCLSLQRIFYLFWGMNFGMFSKISFGSFFFDSWCQMSLVWCSDGQLTRFENIFVNNGVWGQRLVARIYHKSMTPLQFPQITKQPNKMPKIVKFNLKFRNRTRKKKDWKKEK